MIPRVSRNWLTARFRSLGLLLDQRSRPLWLRVALSLPLLVGAFALVGLPGVLGEGSANLEANGGKRALTEWRTSLYGNLLPRRTLFKVYATVGEEIAMGSSGVGVGSGDIAVWTPGHITAPLTVALPAPDFRCSSQPGTGQLTTRAQEVAGPAPAAGGYTPCVYTATTTGVYDVAFYGPSGDGTDLDGNAGTIAAPVIGATQASGVSMWDITVRPIATPGTPISGRVFTDYLAQITGGNGPSYRVQSTLWAVTSDGFQYRIDLRGLDPNGFILYGNTVGFLNPDGATPLYHDLVADINPLTNIEGGVTLAPPTGLLFFALPAADLPSSIVPTPVAPAVNSITFQGTAGVVSGVPGTVYSTGGNIVYDGNISGVAHVIIVPNPGGIGGCAGATYDPTLPTNRSIVAVVSAGVQNLAWDGKDNSGAYMATSWTGNGGSGYCFNATLHAGEYHFPLLDAENSMLGGPTITLLNPPGGVCPFATCRTAFFDDRGYRTTSGAVVGTVGSVLPGPNPPPPPAFSATGFDTASTTIRAYGNDGSTGFGNQKGLDLWTYFPSQEVVGRLYVVPQGASDIAITKTHTGDFVVGVPGVYTLSVRNVGSGSLAGPITVSDPVPAGLNAVSAAGTGWACGVSGQDVTCTVTPAGGLASGATLPGISVTVLATPAAVPSVINTATVANPNDLNPDNNASSSPTRIQVVADLAITKTDSLTMVNAGATTTYTLVVTNLGPSPVTGALLADPVAANIAKTAVACAPTPGACVTPPTVAQLEGGTFALPVLASGATYRLVVTATVAASAGSVTNTTTVGAPTGVTDPTPGNNSATDTDTVSPVAGPALSLVKTATPRTYAAVGDVIGYTFVVTNTGDVTLDGPFSVSDDKTTNETCPATASLVPGASITCTASYAIARADLDARSVTNVASATNGTVTSPTVSATVTKGNGPPIANDDSATTARGTPVTIDVLANDTDPDGTLDPTSVAVTALPVHGTVSVYSATGAVTYAPDTSYSGADSFGYRVCDNHGACATATVRVTISRPSLNAGGTRLPATDTATGPSSVAPATSFPRLWVLVLLAVAGGLFGWRPSRRGRQSPARRAGPSDRAPWTEEPPGCCPRPAFDDDRTSETMRAPAGRGAR